MKKPFPLKTIKGIGRRKPGSINEVVHETTSGGIVYRINPKTQQVELLLIKDVKGRWTIPKGHVEPGEETGATAEREIREETGLLDMEVLCWLGKVNFRYKREKSLVLMVMHIWLVKALGDTNKLDPEEWLTDVKWFSANETIDKIAYEDISKIILLGMKKIREGDY
ncbi:MAG: NUDIX domain-containing protein [Patescibacteria group bacterium]|jgi:8-oxo-dGTP pyrophosphatase MutT (NUDIX family)|nr:NUDIX domain-containing protein [Patescibacteria group bacterium]